MAEEGYVTIDSSNAGDYVVGARGDLVGGFTAFWGHRPDGPVGA